MTDKNISRYFHYNFLFHTCCIKWNISKKKKKSKCIDLENYFSFILFYFTNIIIFFFFSFIILNIFFFFIEFLSHTYTWPTRVGQDSKFFFFFFSFASYNYTTSDFSLYYYRFFHQLFCLFFFFWVRQKHSFKLHDSSTDSWLNRNGSIDSWTCSKK